MYVNYSRGLIVISISRRHKMFILLINRSVLSVTHIPQVRLGDVCTAIVMLAISVIILEIFAVKMSVNLTLTVIISQGQM